MNFDIQGWLADIGLPEYIDRFREQGIDELSLRELTDADLRELGVAAMGHRKAILRAASKLAGEDLASAATSPNPAFTPQTIFLSYAHKSERAEDFDISEDLVLLIQNELQQDGHTVWIDKEGIRAGSQWRERITAAILEHAHFLSFLSVRSVREPGVCLNEIAIALGGYKHIQTVLAEDERRVAPPLTISHLQWHDFQHWREIRAGKKTGPMGEDWDTWFSQRMARLREVIADAQNARIPGELQKLREILEPRTFEARIVEKTLGFSGRKWLFEETRYWLDESTSRMFWLKAGPGIGKSSFAAQLAHQARSAVVGFFMCDFQGRKDPEESAREAVCTLAFQLASRLPDYRLKLLHGLQLDQDKILKRTADELFEYLLTEPLNRSGKIPESTRLCLVVDGLDEAGRADGGNSLAELLAKHAQRLPEWLGVLVTSRPEPYLEQMLKPLSSISIDGQSTQNRQDLADWIDARLPDSLKDEERQRVIGAVIDKSGGTFLYLSLVEKDRTLDMARPESLPDQLDGIFKQNFTRYFPDPDAYGKKTEPFLRLMAAAPGPLPALMGAQILGWSQREVMLNAIEPMGSLLQEREGGLTFFHASLGDWLKDPKRSGTHCLDDGGLPTLAGFIWNQFEGYEQTAWKAQVVNWLGQLIGHTPQWEEAAALGRVAEFLDQHHRLRDAHAVRRRELECIERDVGPGTRDAAACRSSLGDTLERLGDSSGALEQFRVALAIRERLAAQDPDNADWQRDVSVSYMGIGDVLSTQGDLAGALEQYHNVRANAERLAAQDPDNAGWQSDLSGSYNRIGIVLESQGKLAGALDAFRRHLAISERLAAQDLDNSRWQRELAVGYNCIGVVLESQGKLAEALDEYRKALNIRERLAAQDPDNAGWQSDLAVSYNRIGGVLESQGNLAGALEEFRKNLGIIERLAAQDPDSAERQSDLSVSYSCIGVVLESQGELADALEKYRKSMAIAERLAAQDPDNARWRRELGASYNCIGGVLESLGDLAGALEEYRKSMVIAERLAAQSPDNTEWQRELGASYNCIGRVREYQGSRASALEDYRKALDINGRLASQDPSNAGWQRALSVSYIRIGGVLKSQGDLVGALDEYCQALAIAERLAAQDPDNAGWHSDLAFTLFKVGDIHERLGQFSQAASTWQQELELRTRMAAQSSNPSEADDELASCHNQIGGALEAMGDFEGAREAFSEYLKFAQSELERDPEDTTKMRNVAVGQASVAWSELALGNLERARALQTRATDTFQVLRDADDVGSEMDWAAGLALGAEVARAIGDLTAMATMQRVLASLDLGTDEPEGRFRKRFMPLIRRTLAQTQAS